ncbi:hypothetical protein NX059_009358 [Plenodomus lindquistii]|nr:hypothetical protein NX059_009358 [Plenodomus lindquistii]
MAAAAAGAMLACLANTQRDHPVGTTSTAMPQADASIIEANDNKEENLQENSVQSLTATALAMLNTAGHHDFCPKMLYLYMASEQHNYVVYVMLEGFNVRGEADILHRWQVKETWKKARKVSTSAINETKLFEAGQTGVHTMTQIAAAINHILGVVKECRGARLVTWGDHTGHTDRAILQRADVSWVGITILKLYEVVDEVDRFGLAWYRRCPPSNHAQYILQSLYHNLSRKVLRGLSAHDGWAGMDSLCPAYSAWSRRTILEHRRRRDASHLHCIYMYI